MGKITVFARLVFGVAPGFVSPYSRALPADPEACRLRFEEIRNAQIVSEIIPSYSPERARTVKIIDDWVSHQHDPKYLQEAVRARQAAAKRSRELSEMLEAVFDDPSKFPGIDETALLMAQQQAAQEAQYYAEIAKVLSGRIEVGKLFYTRGILQTSKTAIGTEHLPQFVTVQDLPLMSQWADLHWSPQAYAEAERLQRTARQRTETLAKQITDQFKDPSRPTPKYPDWKESEVTRTLADRMGEQKHFDLLHRTLSAQMQRFPDYTALVNVPGLPPYSRVENKVADYVKANRGQTGVQRAAETALERVAQREAKIRALQTNPVAGISENSVAGLIADVTAERLYYTDLLARLRP